MTIRTILAAASGGSASDSAVAVALDLAQRFAAHVEGFHVRHDVRAAITGAADLYGMPLSGEWIDKLVEEGKTKATTVAADFTAAAARQGIALVTAPAPTGVSASWREEVGDAASLVSRRARFFDLVVLGRSDRVIEAPYTDTVEETLIQSGRPVLLAPARVPAKLGETIAFGWDGSAAAVRALAAAMPLLAAAKQVFVIIIGERHHDSATGIIEHLAWRGIAATRRAVATVAGVGPGEQLLGEARDEGADLLVMGGFGHTPWREMIFGGVTRDLLARSLLPLLMSH